MTGSATLFIKESPMCISQAQKWKSKPEGNKRMLYMKQKVRLNPSSLERITAINKEN